MQIYYTRCKHCGQVYTYNTYGNEDGCTHEYRADCAKVIQSIPVKFEPRWQRLDNPYFIELFQRIEKSENEKKEKRKKEMGDNMWPEMVPILLSSWGEYDNCAEMHHAGKHYRMYWNDDNPDVREFYIEMEYDLINNKFTDVPWRHYENGGYEDYYYHQHIERLKYDEELQDVKPMSPPMGQLLYFDIKDGSSKFDWMSDYKYTPSKQVYVKPPKKKHKLESFTYDGNGYSIKEMIKTGNYYYDGKSVISVKKGININDLMDNMEYEYTIEYYEDDRLKETLANIRIK